MNIVDQDNWQFRLSNSSQVEKLHGLAKPDTVLTFPRASDLIRHLANDDEDDFIKLNHAIERRIDSDPVAAAWRKNRSRLHKLHHFPKYRRSEFDRYHSAARAVKLGVAKPAQIALVSGLGTEIDASRIIVPRGQTLFHGRANTLIVDERPYPAFLSTSLNPVVARNSSFRRAGIASQNGRPVVCVLRLDVELPALWGHVGKSHEYELLLPRNLIINEVCRYAGSKFDVLNALVIARA